MGRENRIDTAQAGSVAIVTLYELADIARSLVDAASETREARTSTI